MVRKEVIYKCPETIFEQMEPEGLIADSENQGLTDSDRDQFDWTEW